MQRKYTHTLPIYIGIFITIQFISLDFAICGGRDRGRGMGPGTNTSQIPKDKVYTVYNLVLFDKISSFSHKAIKEI